MIYAGSDHDYWLARGDDEDLPDVEEDLDLEHDLEPTATIPTADEWEEQRDAHESLIDDMLDGEDGSEDPITDTDHDEDERMDNDFPAQRED